MLMVGESHVNLRPPGADVAWFIDSSRKSGVDARSVKEDDCGLLMRPNIFPVMERSMVSVMVQDIFRFPVSVFLKYCN
jgi:hypothetical protein